MNDYCVAHLGKSLLLVIDVQNDFALKGATAEIDGTFSILPKIKNVIEKYRENQKPIIHVVRLYESDGSNVDICRKDKIENGQ